MNPHAIMLAQLIGPVYLLVTLMFLFQPETFDIIMKDFKKNPALSFFMAIATTVIGLAWVNYLFSFANFTEGVLTVIGIIALIKGVTLLIFPNLMFKFNTSGKGFKVFAAIFSGVLGVLFVSVGYGLL